MPAPRPRRVRGFTLIELLVVITIIVLVSAATLPTILPAINHRQSSDAASLLQVTLNSARDSASRANAPAGLRFLRDKTLAETRPGVLAYSQMVPISLAPEYSEGSVAVLNGSFTSLTTPLTIYGPTTMMVGMTAVPLPPTSWYWNIRRGEKIRINGSGPFYTVVGPMGTGLSTTWNPTVNPEGFINEGPPGTTPSGPNSAEILILSNGRDDNGNGYVDELYDGVDNDGNGTVDDEAEPESLIVPVTAYSPYAIVRRPMVSERARVVSLPSDIVIDATTYNGTRERSRLPLDPTQPIASGALQSFDILFGPNGQLIPSSPYAGTANPQSLPPVPFFHFWLTEREGMQEPQTPTAPNLNALPMPPTLRGERRLVSLNTRTGMVTVTMIEQFDPTNLNLPYIAAQAGLRDKQ